MPQWKFSDDQPEASPPDASSTPGQTSAPETTVPAPPAVPSTTPVTPTAPVAPVLPAVPRAPQVAAPQAPSPVRAPQAPVMPQAPTVAAPAAPAPAAPAPVASAPAAKLPTAPAANQTAFPTPPQAKPQPNLQSAPQSKQAPAPQAAAAQTPMPQAPTQAPQNAMPRMAPPPPHMIPRGNAPAQAAPNTSAGARPQPALPATPNAPSLPGIGGPVPGGAATAALHAEGRGVRYTESHSQWREWIDRLDPVANWLFRITVIAAGISLAWLLFSIFGNNAGQISPNDPAGAQVANDMRLAARILHFSLILMAVSTLILMLDVAWLGPALAVAGLVLHFGSPLALKAIGQSVATVGVVKVLQGTGFALLFFGLCKYSVDLFRWLTQLPDRMKARADVGVSQKAEAAQQRVARDATMFSPCWKLPYCREVIRKQCPAFLAKKRCWKFGRGCYCDEEMISRIIRGESIDTIKAPTRQSRQGKPPCGRCHIFLEHQGLKYKMLSPLAVPGTVIGMYAIWPLYSTAFTAVSQRMDVVWNRLSFDPNKIRPGSFKVRDDVKMPTANDVSQLSPEQISHYAMVMFGVILGFFVLIYISKFIEWAIFKAKW